MKTKNILGDIIYQARMAKEMTQDEFGSHYSVSGPAIFKFEKGYVRPSLPLWLNMACDAEVPERRAVLLWLKSKLPEQYQEYVELQGAAAHESEKAYKAAKKKKKNKAEDYAQVEDPAEMRALATKDKALPKGLRDLLDDDELWSLYKPTGHEINLMRDIFAPLGRGSRDAYRESLRLIREFTHSF